MAEIGHFALILALGVAIAQTVLPVIGYLRRDSRWLAIGVSGAQTQFGLIVLAYAALTLAFIYNDFSLKYVEANSHSALPLIYRLSAVWGAHEGSLLLWVLMLTGWGFAVSLSSRRLPADIAALVLATMGSISVGFLLFMLFTSNPFERQFPVPLEGHDLNPLLQDPGLIIHPPTLYMGYVGLSVAFSFAIAALITGKLDVAWARWTRPWTTTAWLFLTMGITLGSWWAYNELGWGGWWFWDPVENASFMPWLVGTALIHSLAVTEKRGVLKSWTVLLAILAFSLSLLGTFLVRSGVLVSVHAFATDPARGVFILAFLTVVLGSALLLYAIRAPKLVSDGAVELMSREGLLLLNNVFLVAAAAAVLIGTLYPLVVDALGIGKISVGPPYFNSIFLPLMMPLAVLVGMSARVGWKQARLRDALWSLRWIALGSVICAVLLPFVLERSWAWMAILGTALAVWVMIGALLDVVHRVRARRDRWQGLRSIPSGTWGMTLAHLGLGFWIFGVTYASLFSVEKDVRLAPGQAAEIGAYTFTFQGTQHSEGVNYRADTGSVIVERNGRLISKLQPEKRLYPSQGSVMTESAVDHNPRRDLYVALGEPIGDQDWALRLYYKPFIRMVWFGGVLMFIGGIFAASDRRYRLARHARAAAASDATAAV
ncbi:MAG: heme lyase CcmF/NrfE family subunit [Hydrocarboniphaga sp.]|uniref:heme lyase CcmF/NrfE family subunit n=1 Tax=Hydrocarboniphaga sp. TaxID=2033016 RepID=UPI002607E61C|nr:heme lyase CcmF/NrfE family subunit [Hydrocarboniphaga sp.]MDB5971096.1 heme lyase CcmF/NrfE family subunit [Hydrocarboniphaga sp.]